MADVDDRLIVQLEADITRLEANMRKGAAQFASRTAEINANAKKTADSVEAAFGKIDIGKAFDRTFDRTRFAALEAGSAKIPIFGSALEELGGAGLIAAAGVAAAAFAFEKAKEAMEWAEQLEVTAKKLGVTTTALQEMDYAAVSTGVDQAVLRDGLQKVSQAIGVYQSNIKDARVNSVFEALGISKNDARQWQSPIEGLEAIADKIHALKSATEQLSIARQLRVPDDMVPLLQAGGDAIRQMANAAAASGAVMDHEVVARAAELGRQVNQVNQVIGVQMKTAFANLAPEVLSIVNMLANMAKFAADTAWNLNHIKPDLTIDYTGAPQDYLNRRATQAQKRLNDIQAENSAGGHQGYFEHGNAHGQVGAVENEEYKKAWADWLAIGTAVNESRKTAAEYEASMKGGAAPALAAEKTARTKRTPNDPTASVDEVLDQASKKLAEAQASLTQNVLEHAKLEKAAVDDELKDQNDKIDAKIASIENDKSLDKAKKEQLVFELTLASGVEMQAASAKKAVIDREAENKIIEARLAHEGQIADYATAILSDAASMAGTSKQRRTIALAQLAIEQNKAQSDVSFENQKLIEDAGPDPLAQEMAQLAAAQNKAALDAAQKAQTQKVLDDTASPGNAYAAGLNRTYGGDLTDQFESMDVSGITQFGDELDQVIMKTRTAKEAFHEWALSVAKDLLSMATKALVERPLANLLFPGNTANSGGAQAMSTAATATALGGLTVSATAAATALAAIGAMGVTGMPGAATGGQPGTILGGFASILRFFPGFAGGTDSAPGGPAWVGEDGPELVNLGRGATVTNMGALQAARNISPASVRMVSSTYAPSFNLSGAVMTEDLLNQMNVIAARQGIAATARAVSLARTIGRDDMNKRARQAFGRG